MQPVTCRRAQAANGFSFLSTSVAALGPEQGLLVAAGTTARPRYCPWPLVWGKGHRSLYNC